MNQLFDRNGNAGPSIWVDGRIVGGWVQRGDRSIAVQMFTDIGRERLLEVHAAAHLVEQLVGAKNFTVRFPAPMQKALLASTLPGTMAK